MVASVIIVYFYVIRKLIYYEKFNTLYFSILAFHRDLQCGEPMYRYLKEFIDMLKKHVETVQTNNS